MAKQPKQALIDLQIVSVFLAELFGTAILVYLCCSGGLLWRATGPVSSLQSALTSGIAALIAIQIFGSISGAHINPAVTTAAFIYESINFKVQISWAFF